MAGTNTKPVSRVRPYSELSGAVFFIWAVLVRRGRLADTIGAGVLAASLPNAAFVLVSILVWSLKVFLFCAFQLLIRWSLPRLRADQLLRLGWQRLLPISIANVVLAAGWILLRK